MSLYLPWVSEVGSAPKTALESLLIGLPSDDSIANLQSLVQAYSIANTRPWLSHVAQSILACHAAYSDPLVYDDTANTWARCRRDIVRQTEGFLDEIFRESTGVAPCRSHRQQRTALKTDTEMYTQAVMKQMCGLDERSFQSLYAEALDVE